VPVEIREETLELKTYLRGEADPNPPFHRRGHWRIYPYPMLDDLGEAARPVRYRALVVENEYLRVTVLPELGGHLHSAVDKGTGQDLFYHNHVVKPGLIALRGAWISGGIEWNFPRGHSVTTLSPVDSRLVQAGDGSATIWVGDIEQIYRMAWAVGIRLRPGSSLIETEVRLMNRTALPHPYYFWANAAVPARDDMRLIYPATRARTWQGPVAWPMHQGKDLSRYRAFPVASDSFMLDSLEDFFGVYYEERDFGVVHVADVHQCFGKKYFTWGTAESGRIWASVLSDEDGPYCEIQSGRFVDQSIWRLLPPHHALRWLEYWWPVKGTGGFARANTEAAVRISRGDGQIDLGAAVTQRLDGARVRISAGTHVLHELRADLSPDRPLRLDLPSSSAWPQGPLTLTLLDTDGREIIRGTENQPPRTLAAGSAGSQPAASDTDSEPAGRTPGFLLREAVRTEEAGNSEEARAAYQRALNSDPACVAAAIAAGRLALESGPEGAVARLREAAAAAPESAEAAYYLGVALRRAGRVEEAEFELWRAAHSPQFAHAARVELGLITMARSDWTGAAAVLEQALQYRQEGTKARALLAAALRREGRVKQAAAEVAAARQALPLDRLVAAEAHFCAAASGQPRVAAARLRELKAMIGSAGFEPVGGNPWLELGFDYAGAGLLEEAVALLAWAQRRVPGVKRDPLVCYALAFWLGSMGRSQEAAEYRREASKLSTDIIFPHHWELEAVLREALAGDPADGPAHYYLGTLLYSQGRRKEALAEWEAAAQQMTDSAVLHRDLGLAYREVAGDLEKAEGALRQAVACRPLQPRAYLELVEVLEARRAHPRKRLEVLDAAPAEVQRRSLVAAHQIAACLALGAWDPAVSLLTTHSFHRWETEYRMRYLYVEAYCGRGAARFDHADLNGARQDFEAALDYPANLRIGRPAQTEDARPRWCAGLVREALGDMAAAGAHWEAAAAEGYRRHSHTGAMGLSVYRALSLRKLGRREEAESLLEQEVATARKRAEAEPASAAAQLALGLALKAAGKPQEAEGPLRRSLELDPWQPRAARLLDRDIIL
jgi:tetratricopeptide (TPR) repeat protein